MSRTVVLELAGEHALARDLVAGGVFVPGAKLPLNEDCELVLRGAGTELRLSATCVWVDGDRGSGLQLRGCDAGMKQQIALMAQTASVEQAAPSTVDEAADDVQAAEVDVQVAVVDVQAAVVDVQAAVVDVRAAEVDAQAAEVDAQTAEVDAQAAVVDVQAAEVDVQAIEVDSVDDGDAADANAPDQQADAPTDETAEDDEAGSDERKRAASLHERLRGLTLPQQIARAHKGEVSERIMLERMYGKNVWEALLRNQRLTGPEVARIARMGALPRTMMEIIVGNGAWLQIPEVRRSLLSNPRLGTDQILRVLRLLPKHELKLAGIQTAYPNAVREAAKRLLKDMNG